MDAHSSLICAPEIVEACQFGNLEVIQTELAKGGERAEALVCGHCTSGNASGLHWSAINGHGDIVRMLLDAGANPDDIGGPLCETPVHWASRQGHTESVVALVKAGGGYDARNGLQQTPLHLAAQAGHNAVAVYLMALGANTSACDQKRFTPLLYASQALKGCPQGIDMLRFLLVLGKKEDCLATDLEEENNALHWAISGLSDSSAIVLLLDSGVPLKDKNFIGLTPDMLAREKRMYSTYNFLRKARDGSNPKIAQDIPLKGGLLIFPLVLLWMYLCVILLPLSYGLAAGVIGIIAIVSKFRSSLLHPLSLSPLGLVAGSIIAIFLSFVFCVAPSRSFLGSLFLSAIGIAILLLLYKVHKTNPGIVPYPSLSNRKIELQRMIETNVEHAHDICKTCLVKKELRTKHCEICKGCVRRFDHHCPFIGNCVGHGNHRFFIYFLGLAMCGMLRFLWEARGVALNSPREKGDPRFGAYWGLVAVFHLMLDSPPTGLAISLASLLLFWVIGLLGSQLFMMANDRTTYEAIKGRVWLEDGVELGLPFWERIPRNCFRFFCVNTGPFFSGQYLLPFTRTRCCDHSGGNMEQQQHEDHPMLSSIAV
eukprot:128093_1